jgi:hypothetical protein
MLRKIPKIINDVECWNCHNCKEWLPKDNFYKDARSPNKIKSNCKKCHVKITMKTRDPINHRIKTREWQRSSGYARRPEVMERERKRNERRKDSIENKCRNILNDAVSNGIIIRPDKCSECNANKNIQGHHWSYYRPLEVKWLCPLCHAAEHRKEEITMLKDRQELRGVTTAISPEYVYLVSYFVILENNNQSFGDVLVQSPREHLIINQNCDLYKK